MTMSDVTVVIPTFRRPQELLRAAQSVIAQANAPTFSLLIVDNDPKQSARNIADRVMSESDGVCVRYVHEPNAGVANARNTAMENVTSQLVAFLDDDQSVPSNWLRTLIEFHNSHPAPVTFGPVLTKLPEGDHKHQAYLESFFARTLQKDSGYIDHYYGCGNAFIDLSLIEYDGPLFDPSMNETGGEDDLFFRNIKEKGARFGWCADAPAFEHVPASRARLEYTLKRTFSHGQGPITLARTSVPTQYGRILMWMLIGAGKATLNGVLYAVHWLARSPARITYLDRAIQGAGKVFWWVRFKFYGAAVANEK